MSIVTQHADPRFGASGGTFSAWALAGLLRELLTRQQTRKALRKLDSQQLTDVGISREQAIAEAAKPFWVR